MLQLYADGQQLDTAGVKFNITRKNPLFQNKMEGSYVYNLKLPLTDRNKKIINYAHRLDGHNDIPTPNILSLFNGLELFQGPLIYTGGKDRISGHVAMDQGNFLYAAQNKFLDQVDYGKKTFADEAAALTYFNSIRDKYYPDTDFALPHTKSETDVYLPNGTTGYFEKDTMNFWDHSAETYIITSAGDRGIIVPHLYLQFVLKKVFSESGYQFDDRFFAVNDDWAKLIIWNSYNANGGIPDEGDKLGYDSDITKIIYGLHCPHVKISDFITGLQNLINMRFFFNHTTKKVTAKDSLDILSDPNYIDITNKVISGHELKFKKKNGFELSSMPDSGDSHFQISVDHGEAFLDQYGGVVENVSDLPSYYLGYRYYYVSSENGFYAWHNNTQTWSSIGSLEVIHKFFTPPSEYKIESCISTLRKCSYANFSQHGNAAIDYRNITPRILFYNGMVYSVYYFPSSLYRRNDKRLHYRDIFLYTNRWKKYLDWILDPKIIKIKAQLSAADIKDFDFSRKYRISGINYLVKELKAPVTDNAIGPATLECWKV